MKNLTTIERQAHICLREYTGIHPWGALVRSIGEKDAKRLMRVYSRLGLDINNLKSNKHFRLFK